MAARISSRRVDTRERPTLPSQDFLQLQRTAQLRRVLFVDPEFPAINSSLYYSRGGKPSEPIDWKRPKEISKNPQLFSNEPSRLDVNQGILADSWLLAAISSLSLHKTLLYRVVPEDQGFGRGYAGIFHFQFWQYGQWVDVVIDDRLPVTRNGKLAFLHSSDLNEFWCALLEKAFAKLCGSYEALKEGSPFEGMTDLTGGIADSFSLQKSPPSFIEMLKFDRRDSLMCCYIDATEVSKLPNGLVKGQAYSVTAVQNLSITTSRLTRSVPLVRLRNPQGGETEWNGPWSDKSREWRLVGETEKRELDLKFNRDGEFWMSYEDFCSSFTTLEVCCLGPSTFCSDETRLSNWEMQSFSGFWNVDTAGGCSNYPETFAKNQKYLISLEGDADEDGKCSLIVSLMQKDRRQLRRQGLQLLTIGFAIYKAPEDGVGVMNDPRYFRNNNSVAESDTFINKRETTARFKLPLGDYIIIPSTFEPGEEGDFLLRVFAEGSTDREATTTDAEDSVSQKIATTFYRLAGDDQAIDTFELRNILTAAYSSQFGIHGFSLTACRDLIALADDGSGKLKLEDFYKVWTLLREWKGTFKKYDADSSEHLNTYEFRKILHAVGFRLSNQGFQCLCVRYANKEGVIPFDDCLGCFARLKRAEDISNMEGLPQTQSKFVEALRGMI